MLDYHDVTGLEFYYNFYIIINIFGKDCYLRHKYKNQKDNDHIKYGIERLKELKQLDYELYIRTTKSHLSEEQWEWLIQNFKGE